MTDVGGGVAPQPRASPEPTAPVSFRHRLEYAGFRLLRGVLSVLPARVALGLGEALGWFTGVVVRLRRDVVDENLRQAFPDASDAWRRRVAVESYRHLGRESVMTFRIATASAERIREMSEVDGLDELRQVLDRGDGLVVFTGHLGNWEMSSAAVAARGLPIDAVMYGQRNRRFDEDVRETRGRLGMGIILRDAAPRGVLRSLAKGRLVALLADQNVTHSGVFVDFFGKVASTPRGPAVFSLRTGAPLWVGWGVRTQKTPPRYRVVSRPLTVELVEDHDENVLRITRAATAAIEAAVREYPEQYFWHHKRWKTRPPEERDE